MSSNAYLRRALLERIKHVGVCPDMRNDPAAVLAVCDATGAKSADVAKELAQMRVETIQERFSRMGSSSLHSLLAGVSASRYVLANRKSASEFATEFERRKGMTRAELIADLDGFDSLSSAEKDDSPSRLHEAERKRLHEEIYGQLSPSTTNA